MDLSRINHPHTIHLDGMGMILIFNKPKSATHLKGASHLLSYHYFPNFFFNAAVSAQT